MANLKITLMKSTIGRLQKQKDTIAALGLTKLGSSVIKQDSPSLQGMLNVVSHLVKVEQAD
ncbi:MAG: 50S ribosomal protein L30 [Christensenellales bacterium]|jgi:large subunit ribosomal protein L30